MAFLVALLGSVMAGELWFWHFNSPSQPGPLCSPVSNPIINNGYLAVSPSSNSGYVLISNAIMMGGLEFSISTRVLFKNFTGGRVFDFGSDANQQPDNIFFSVNQTTASLSWIVNNRTYAVTCNWPGVTNTWTVFTTTVATTNATLYVNGQLCAVQNMTFTARSTVRARQYIGKTSTSDANMNGFIDFVWYIPRTLTSTEVTANLLDLDMLNSWYFQSPTAIGSNLSLVGGPSITGGALALTNNDTQWAQLDSSVVLGGALTIAARVMMTAFANWPKVIDFANGPSQDNIYLGSDYFSDAVVWGNYQGSSAQDLTCGGFWQLNQWIDVVATVLGNTLTVFKNGTQYCTANSGWQPNSLVRSQQYIGKSQVDAQDGFAGKIRWVTQWPRVLSTFELSYLSYTLPTPMFNCPFSSSGFVFPLTAYGDPPLSSGSIQFFGLTTQWVEISNTVMFNGPPYSFAFRIMVTSTGSIRVLEFGNTTSANYLSIYTGSNQLCYRAFRVSTGASAALCCLNNLVGYWYDYVITQVGNVASIYRGGMLCANGTMLNAGGGKRSMQYIGKSITNSAFFAGSIDYIMFYAKQLSLNEILLLSIAQDRASLYCSAPNITDPKISVGTCIDGGNLGTKCDMACNSPYSSVTSLSGTCLIPDNSETAAWVGQSIVCARRCPVLYPPQFGSILQCDGGWNGVNFEGSSCIFACDPGFNLTGYSLTCTSNGNWSGTTPTCSPIVCPKFPSLTYGSSSCSGPYGSNSYQAFCSFTCQDGFVALGATNSTCLENGHWSFPMPSCASIYCPIMNNPANGTRSCNSGAYGGPGTFLSTCDFQCNAHFSLVGNSRVTCQAAESWVPTSPTCSLVMCPALADPPNGVLQCNGGIWLSPFAATSQCNVVCNQGFSLNGGPISCLDSGIWSGAFPTCSDINECALGACEPGAMCFNAPGTYACGPTFRTNVTSTISNSAILAGTTGEAITAILSIGYQVQLQLDNVTFLQSGSSSVRDFPCQPALLSNGSYVTQFTCSVAAALGADFCLMLPYQISFLPGLYYLQSSLFSYPPPFIAAGTLRLYGGQPRNTIYANATDGDLISFDGMNFLPDPTLLSVTYGAGSFSTLCTLRSDLSSTTTISCRVAAGTTGINLVFTVNANGQKVTGNDTYSVVDVPSIIRVASSVCATSELEAYDCPTLGNVPITVYGLYFKPVSLNVLISGVVCLTPSMECDVIETEQCWVTCILPPGTGFNQSVVVSAANKYSQPLPFLSYAAPVISALQGCTQGTDALSVVSCARSGGDSLTIFGSNFGALGASVAIGSARSVTAHDVFSPQTTLTCITLMGSTLLTAVQVFQSNGPVSQEVATVGYSQCSPGQLQNGTATACATCSPGRYSASEGAVDCALCDPGRYAPNQGAENCLPCSPGKYQGSKGQSDCLLCDPGFYLGGEAGVQCFACDSGTNQNTSGATRCEACRAGSFSKKNTTSGSGPLVCELCPLGSYSPTSSQVQCEDCPAGRYGNNTGLTRCYDCNAGSYQSNVGQQYCPGCPSGNYAPVPGRNRCFPCDSGTAFNSTGAVQCDVCKPGTVSKRNTSLSDGPYTCQSCPPGMFMPAPGQDSCLVCPAGKFAKDPGQSVCGDCGIGKFQSNPAAAECVDCPSGSYTDVMGRVECTPCPGGWASNLSGVTVCSMCEPGTFSTSGGTPLTECKPCSPGTYVSAFGQVTCLPCVAGFYASSPGALACEPCPEGSSRSSPGARDCSVCQPGKYTAVSGRDACSLCPPGKFTDNFNSTECMDCPPGQLQPDIGASLCLDCAAGQSNSAYGQRSCVACAPGTFTPLPQSVVCEPCPIGSAAALPGSTNCSVCTPGKFSPLTGRDSCTSCPGGRYTPYSNATGCFDCDIGYFQYASAATGCDMCPPGSAAGATKQTSCVLCSPGSFSSTNGSTACEVCPEGNAADSNGAVTCSGCTPGRFSAVTGRAQCDPCPAGKSVAYSDATVCKDCSIGTAQGFSGMDRCIPCVPGSFSSIPGTTSCTACSVGKYNANSSLNSCIGCTAGQYQSHEGQTTCQLCNEGTFSYDSQATCSQCAPGLAASAKGMAVCSVCPTNSAPSEKQDQCRCDAGFYWENGACFKCPSGALCDQSGMTRDALQTRDGYYLVDADNLGYIKCLNPKNCKAGNCTGNKVGVLCNECAPGYSLSPWTKDCVICPSKSSALASLIVTIIALIIAVSLLYLYLIVIALRKDQATTTATNEKASSRAPGIVPKMPSHLRSHSFLENGGTPVTSNQSPRNSKIITDDLTSGTSLATNSNRGSALELKGIGSGIGSGIGLPSPRGSGLMLGSTFRNVRPIGVTGIRNLDHSDSMLHSYLKGGPIDRKHVGDDTYSVKIALNFFQILSNLASSPLSGALLMPSFYLKFLAYFSVINVDFIPWQSVTCLVPANYFSRMLTFTLAPLGLIFVLMGVVLITLQCDRRDMRDISAMRERRATFRLIVVRASIFTTFVMYPLISSNVLAFFSCIDVGGRSVLAADFTVQCGTPLWKRWAIYAVVMVIVYPIGVPMFYLAILYRNRNQLNSRFGTLGLGFLHESYTRQAWWFETAVMVDKLTLTSLLQFLPQSAVLPTALGVTGVFLIILVLLQPEVRLRNWLLHMLAHIEILLVLLFWHFVYQADLTSAPLGADVVVSGLFIMLTIMLCGLLFLDIVKRVRNWITAFIRGRRIAQANEQDRERLKGGTYRSTHDHDTSHNKKSHSREHSAEKGQGERGHSSHTHQHDEHPGRKAEHGHGPGHMHSSHRPDHSRTNSHTEPDISHQRGASQSPSRHASVRSHLTHPSSMSADKPNHRNEQGAKSRFKAVSTVLMDLEATSGRDGAQESDHSPGGQSKGMLMSPERQSLSQGSQASQPLRLRERPTVTRTIEDEGQAYNVQRSQEGEDSSPSGPVINSAPNRLSRQNSELLSTTARAEQPDLSK